MNEDTTNFFDRFPRKKWTHNLYERKLGDSISLVGMQNVSISPDGTETSESFEYWIEIDKLKIPSTIGYCRTSKEFQKQVEGNLVKFLLGLIKDSTPVLVQHQAEVESLTHKH